MKKILSYGGGVQTFAMLVLIEMGILEKPDLLIMSDTKAEYPETYDHVENVAKPLAKKLEIEWVDVCHKEGIINGYMEKNSIPLAGFRSCTHNYKVRPIHDYLREYLGDEKINGKASIETWIGISTDESRRIIPRSKQSPKWILITYPLIELDYSRRQLIEIIKKSGYPMPRKSGCFMCPYHGFKGFIDLKVNYPELNKIAIEMEERYFANRPERKYGFLTDNQISLKELNEIPSLFEFEQIIGNESECQSGSCFL